MKTKHEWQTLEWWLSCVVCMTSQSFCSDVCRVRRMGWIMMSRLGRNLGLVKNWSWAGWSCSSQRLQQHHDDDDDDDDKGYKTTRSRRSLKCKSPRQGKPSGKWTRRSDAQETQYFYHSLCARALQQEKPSIAYTCSSTGNIALTRDWHTDKVTLTFDLLTQNKWVSSTHRGTFLCHVWWS